MPNVADRFWQHAASNPDAVALRTTTEQISYGELARRSATCGGMLRDLGVAVGDRVLLVAPTVPEFVAAYLGAQLVGAIAITMNTMAATPEIGYVLDDSGARVALAWRGAQEATQRAVAERNAIFRGLAPGVDSETAQPVTEPVSRQGGDTAVLLYTSGTTGKPKGVELTVDNLTETARLYADQFRLAPGERYGTGLPLFHVFGQAVCLLPVLYSGCSLSMVSPFDPRVMIEMIRDHRLTVVAGVPTMWNALLHSTGDYGPQDFTSLRLAASGGASLPGEVMRAFSQRFDCAILEGYGLTESTGAAAFNLLHREQRVGSVGTALPEISVEVRDAEGKVLPADTVGEIFLRGPNIMKGYWNRPDATAETLTEGSLKTGDLGRLDSDGYLYIVDRAKDLIIRGGYNVYPAEVEDVLYQHPDIVEAAVIGVPDEHYGQEVAAVVVVGTEIDSEQLRAWAKERLSAYKVPRRFAFVDQLPRGVTGKILKRALDWNRLTTATNEEPRCPSFLP
ncbi:class I adenylate-forming enzyme family protein [Nocardia transvalensis]|uniref:class I adenylate-forming enzyme family protein n=1 Tax=Nocardia transvalensis TaxID=37333 RepID=UPI0018959664|nr:AMP-binding protein [Nocardia transvalensis]MBF6332293.1 AMP-binding protein [Nocardia transvalensis]